MLGAVNPSEYVVTEDELIQYGAMGTIIHGMAEMVLKHNDNPTDLFTDFPEEWRIVQEGSLKLSPGNANPKGFVDAHKEINFSVDVDAIEVQMYNDELRLCGTSDLFTTYKGRPCTFDWKTSRSYSAEKKLKYFKQLALYSIMKEAYGYPKDEYLIIGPLNPNNKCGYGKALITDEVDEFREMALEDLRKFQEMYKY